MSNIQDITTTPTPPSQSTKHAVLLFWASWHEPSSEGGHVDTIFRALADNESSGNVQFYRVEAEVVTDLSVKVCYSLFALVCVCSAVWSIFGKDRREEIYKSHLYLSIHVVTHYAFLITFFGKRRRVCVCVNPF
mmetsp:Transcript_17912/g.25578  ORF Transcript_17912/g.25578 Transcript_17912/m.25578 type:complete len:134 (+) Transcript_17912:40-441(+)